MQRNKRVYHIHTNLLMPNNRDTNVARVSSFVTSHVRSLSSDGGKVTLKHLDSTVFVNFEYILYEYNTPRMYVCSGGGISNI